MQKVFGAYCSVFATKLLQGSILGGGSTQIYFMDVFLKGYEEDFPFCCAACWLCRVISAMAVRFLFGAFPSFCFISDM